MSIIASGTTTTTALVQTGNTDGTLQLQVNGTTPSVTLNTLGAVGVGSTPGYGTTGQALISNGSTSAPAWGALGISGGGTNSTATPTAGGAGYGTGTAHAYTAAGTTGQVLTSQGSSPPIWTTPATGAMVFISSATASNSASLVFTGLSSTYDMYLIELIRLLPATNGADLRLNISTDNGSTFITTATYNYGVAQCTTNAAGSFARSNGTSAGLLDGAALGVSSTASNGGMNGSIYIYNPSGASTFSATYFTQFFETTNNGPATVYGGISNSGTTAVNAVRIQPSAGNITSGTVRLYGITNS